MPSLVDIVDGDAQDNVEVLSDDFFAASENGFIINQPTESPWTSAILGGQATLEWMSA